MYAVSDAKKVKAGGRGLQPQGVRVKDEADFKIYTEGAGEGHPEIQVIGPGGVRRPCNVQKLDGTTYEAVYQPVKEGKYYVMISFGGQEIPKSPFEVNVGPYKESDIRAYGPGLVGGVVGYPALFTVDTNGVTGGLGKQEQRSRNFLRKIMSSFRQVLAYKGRRRLKSTATITETDRPTYSTTQQHLANTPSTYSATTKTFQIVLTLLKYYRTPITIPTRSRCTELA